MVIRIDFRSQCWRKCLWCTTTWIPLSEGIRDGRHRTDRLILIGVVLYMSGLSHRRMEQFLLLFGCTVSKSSIERDVATATEAISLPSNSTIKTSFYTPYLLSMNFQVSTNFYMVLEGAGGAYGNDGKVIVTRSCDITTQDVFAHGILPQSVSDRGSFSGIS